MAVLTSGEFAMARAAVSASSSVAAPATVTVTSLEAPSPSAAISLARCWHTAFTAQASSAASGVPGPMGAAPAAALPVAIAMQVSFVEVSESTVTLLNVFLTTPSSTSCSAAALTGASVEMMAIIVAMLGMIMPEPLHMPPTVTVLPASEPPAS